MIDDEGQQLGVMHPREALRIAQEREMDLIEIVPNAKPPVCKIMDYGKYHYDQTKKEKLQRKHQHVAQVKELRFHPHTDTHDFDFKMRHARHFIEQGNKVKAVVQFRGRQLAYKEHGEDLLKRVAEGLQDIAKIEQESKLEGQHMIVIFCPDKTSKKKKPEQQTTKQQ